MDGAFMLDVSGQYNLTSSLYLADYPDCEELLFRHLQKCRDKVFCPFGDLVHP